jgi:hypothetical protein
MTQKSDKHDKSEKSGEYVVVDNPFYDGVQLHPVGARVIWAGPPGNSLLSVKDAPRRRSTTGAPIFADPLGGRGDGTAIVAADPSLPTIRVQ